MLFFLKVFALCFVFFHPENLSNELACLHLGCILAKVEVTFFVSYPPKQGLKKISWDE